LPKVKKIKELHEGELGSAAHEIPKIDVEIGQKNHLLMETNYPQLLF